MPSNTGQQHDFKYGTRAEMSKQDLLRQRRAKMGVTPKANALNATLDKVPPDGVICCLRSRLARCVVENKDFWRHSLEELWEQRAHQDLFALLVGECDIVLRMQTCIDALLVRASSTPDDEIYYPLCYTQHTSTNDVRTTLWRST